MYTISFLCKPRRPSGEIYPFIIQVIARRLPLFLLILACLVCIKASGSKTEKPGHEGDTYVIMVSLDGFRHDYPERVHSPFFDSLATYGVQARWIQSVFPSNTFPAHYSMATGLYPDHHGIVHNHFYHPDLGLTYRMRDWRSRTDPAFYDGEPLWQTAERQGIQAATLFWVGSDMNDPNKRASYWRPYNYQATISERIDTVIGWLSLPDSARPRLIMWYMHEPDAIGHRAGPESTATDSVVMHLDSMMSTFAHKLNQLPIAQNINLIVTSDHGMTAQDPEKVINLYDYLDTTLTEMIEGHNPCYLIRTKEGYIDSVYQSLKRMEHASVWKNSRLPKEYNYGNHPATLDITLLAHAPYTINRGAHGIRSKGAHGYDHQLKDMHAIFYAIGPHFKSNYLSEPLELVDLYPLISAILSLKPAENDGDPKRFLPLLKPEE